jgi:hypothetical protein
LGGAFTLFTSPVNDHGGKLRGWDLGRSTPASTCHNTRDHAVTLAFSGGPARYQPHGVSMHPSFACDAVRGSPCLTPRRCRSAASSTAWTKAASRPRPAAAPNASFLGVSVPAHAHDTIDFTVGCGSNGAWNYDTTGLNAVIVAP